jgi:hypothetical protein
MSLEGHGGGVGSTRWWGHQKHVTVEACLPLDMAVLARQMHFSASCDMKGTFTWIESGSGDIRASSGFVVKTTGEEGWLRLFYERSPTKEAVEYMIVLTTTTPQFGGVRWWAWCPFMGSSERCLQRVRCLYLPPGAEEFACRGCHTLTYRSCQEAHSYDRGTYAMLARLWGMVPREVRARLKANRQG